MSINSKKMLPLALKTPIWQDFLDSFDEEILLLKEEMEKKSNQYAIGNIVDEDVLISILKDFGYDINRILDSSIEFLKQEIRTLVFKIKNKTTYDAYKYFFNIMQMKGEVFNYFYDDLKLVESIDFQTTIYTNLVNHTNKSKFFYGVVPVQNFNTFVNQVLMLDDNSDYQIELDKDIPFYLDSDIVVFSTKHISVDIYPKEIIDVDGEDYLMLEKYSIFLNDVCLYTKKCVETHHVGFLLNFLISSNGIYNEYSNAEYSIPDLKINCSLTLAVTTFSQSNLVILDTDGGMDLDQELTWRLDQDAKAVAQDSIFTKFFYICAGYGKKSFINAEYYPTLSDNAKILGMWDFDTTSIESDLIFQDYSDNNRDLTLIGDSFLWKYDGIIGKSIELCGTDAYLKVIDLILDSPNFSINFWFNISSTQNYSEVTLIDLVFLKVIYDNITNDMTIIIFDGVNTVAGIIDITSFLGLDTMLSVSIDTINLLCYAYINGSNATAIDISTITAISGTNDLTIGSDQANTNFIIGEFDEFRLYRTYMEIDVFTYMYDNMIGNTASGLDKEFFCEPLSSGELYEDNSLYFINSIVKANFIKNQRLVRYIPSTDRYTGYIQTPLPIKRGTFQIKYRSGITDLIAVDDRNNNIQSSEDLENVEGTINYDTGYYDIAFYRTISVVNEVIGTGQVTYTGTFANAPIISAIISVRITGAAYSVVSSELGNWMPNPGVLVSGSLNLLTGDYSLTFSSTGTDVTVNYFYKQVAYPISNSIVTYDYQLDGLLPITEIGIKKSTGEISAYATFPKVELGLQDHISPHFIVYKN